MTDLNPVQSFGPEGGVIDCPEACEVPTGQRLVQVFAEPKPFTIECPNGCNRYVRAVGQKSTACEN